MQLKKRKVLCVNSELSFLENQKKALSHKRLDDNLISFSSFMDAYRFLETQIIEKNVRLHYIILDEKAVSKELNHSLEKLWGLNQFLKKPDIIIIMDENNAFIRNRVMQYPFVTAFLVKPVPSDYIEFLITGQIS